MSERELEHTYAGCLRVFVHPRSGHGLPPVTWNAGRERVGQDGPNGTSDPIAATVRWCRSLDCAPLAPEAVPGTTERERRQLALLGGVAAALYEEQSPSIPMSDLPPMVQKWLKAAPAPPRELIASLKEALKSDADPLALIYERIVAASRRRTLGTFFTPAPVMRYIRKIVCASDISYATVADPGAGVGAFTVGALNWWPESVVHSVDVNLVTLGLLATRPDLQKFSASVNETKGASRLKIYQADFLTWLRESWGDNPAPRIIIGNPPYTRHQGLTAEEKSAARTAAKQYVPGKRAGLSTYFLAASLASLQEHDSLCMLLPGNWLEADYAANLRQKLWEMKDRRIELHLFANNVKLFPNAQVSAMILHVHPCERASQDVILIAPHETDQGEFIPEVIKAYPRLGLLPRALTMTSLWETPSTKGVSSTRSHIKLGDFARIRRGVATGANSFFLRNDEDIKGLPVGSFKPTIGRLRDLPGDCLDQEAHEVLGRLGKPRWLLALDDVEGYHPVVEKLVAEGEDKGVHQSYLCRVRSRWYALEHVEPPALLIGPMGKERFRIVRNLIGAVPTNTLYGISLKSAPADSAMIAKIAEWLSSGDGQRALRAVARQHGDGLLKIEPGALAGLQVPRELIDPLWIQDSMVVE